MATHSDTTRRPLLRATLILIALAAAWWSLGSLRDESTGAPFEAAADRISLGQRYRPDMMARAMPFVDQAESLQQCSRIFRDTAMIRIQARQMAIAAGDAKTADLHRDRAIQDLEKDLICSPATAPSWLFLYTLRANRDHRAAPHLPLLGMSYELAPNEGGLSPLRLRAALPLLPAFGPNMTTYVENDFGMMARDQNQVAAEIFFEANPQGRAALTEILKKVAPANRKRIVERLEVERDITVKFDGEPPK